MTKLPTLVQNHARRFRDRQYVYPVVSRRSGGLSLGVNLSPSARCNFACVYCQVLGELNIKLLAAQFRKGQCIVLRKRMACAHAYA